MTTKDIKKSIKESVQDAIQTGKAKMRPRSYFVARTSLLIIGIVLIVLTLLFLTSFVFFILRLNGVWFVPAFGLRALGPFVMAVPWLLVLVGLIFIILLEWLVKRYSVAWRKPLLYSVAGITVFVFISGFAIAQTSLHRGAFNQARGKGLPIVGGMYRQFGEHKLSNIHRGVVIEVLDNGFLLVNVNEETLTIEVTLETHYLRGSGVKVDDNIVVLGERSGDTVKAFGIRSIDDRHGDFMFKGGKSPRRFR